MYGLNGFAVLAFTAINYFSVRLAKKGRSSKKIIYMLSIFLLLLNSIRYIYIYPFVSHILKIPVEFSTVSYFTVPIIIICHFKKFYGFASYSGLMAGFFYYLALVFSGGPIYGAYDIADVYISMLCHGILYILGFYMISTQKFEKKYSLNIIFGISGIIANALIFRPLMEKTDTLLIYFLLDAIPVSKLLCTENAKIVLPVYYTAVVILLLTSVFAFFRMNKKELLRFATGEQDNTTKEKNCHVINRVQSNTIL